jgi:hypothetical protein
LAVLVDHVAQHAARLLAVPLAARTAPAITAEAVWKSSRRVSPAPDSFRIRISGLIVTEIAIRIRRFGKRRYAAIQ